MNITGAVFAAGLTIAALSLLGAFIIFPWAMATLEVDGAKRARNPFIVVALCLLGIIVGAALVGATA